jgi:repressor LexA
MPLQRRIWNMPLKTAELTSQLTPRQLQLLRAISGFRASQCYSPTIAELACELGISRSTVFEHITELRKKELLSACPGRARSLKPTSKAQELLNRLDGHGSNAYRQLPAGIPLVGRVAAGLPIEAIEDAEMLSLSCYFGSGDDIFALEVTGDSMVGEDIRSGDYVICRRTAVASDGRLVIAIIDEEEATLKRFYKEEKQVRLQPANDDYYPIYSDNCRIEAVVVGLVRKL